MSIPNLRSYDTIFMGCNKIFQEYMDCIDLNIHENRTPQLNDKTFESIVNYSNNENNVCRKLHIKAAQCVEKSLNRKEWNESMKCYKSRDYGFDCQQKIEKSKQNRRNYLQLLITPELYDNFWKYEIAQEKCKKLKVDSILCKNKDGETPECIDKEVLYQSCIWKHFTKKDKVDKFLKCWHDGTSNCKEEKKSVMEDLNSFTRKYFTTLGFENYEITLRGGGFDLYKNVLHPLILISSYRKKE